MRASLLFCVLLLCRGLRADTDWVLVLDRSESMTQNDPYDSRFDAQKIMADLLAQGAEETHRLTIIRFAGAPETVLERVAVRPENLASIKKTISDDPPKGDTDIGAALAMARKVAEPGGRASDVHVFLMSDGVQAGRNPNLSGRLEDEKRAYRDLGVAIHTICLNDLSIRAEEREARRQKKQYYEDSQLQGGEDLLRDVARKTGGQSAQVRPERAIEDILLGLVAPHMSFYRQPLTTRIETWPTDRQLFLVIDRRAQDMKLRIAGRETVLNLGRAHEQPGDFEISVDPYRNRSVVMIRPAENVRWPDHIELLPGPSQGTLAGDVFVISSVRLETLSGLDPAGGAQESVKTRVRENEAYPIRFRVAVAQDITAERKRSIEDALKKATIHVEARDAEGKTIEEQTLAADSGSGAASKLYFVPTRSLQGGTKVKEPFGIVVRASLDAGAQRAGSGIRPFARAPDRSFLVSPSSFEWALRWNWKGEPESSSRLLVMRDVEVELGQEIRLEVLHDGADALDGAEMLASIARPGEAGASRLTFKDGGGVPRAFVTDWIFLPATGEYTAKVTVKSDGVQEVAYRIKVVRDDFRQAGSEYSRDGKDSARGRDLGKFYTGEKAEFSRTRTIDRLSPEATSAYWEKDAASPPKAYLLKKDGGSGGWTIHRQVPLAVEAPKLGAPKVAAEYRAEIAGLEPGQYIVAWPEKRSLGADPISDQRSDRLEVVGRAFAAGFVDAGGKPLELEGGKPSALAGTKLTLRVAPSNVFPASFDGTVTGVLTWARKDVGGPQTATATKGPDGAYLLEFPTTDFHTGPAKLRLVMAWKEGGRERAIEENLEVFARTKALGIAIEAVEEDVLLGQRSTSLKFRLSAIGGQNAGAQRDLLSVWLSQPAEATLGDSDKIYPVDLAADGNALVGALVFAGPGGSGPGGSIITKESAPALPATGTCKLVLKSPVAKLGQDVAACFFNVKPCPFTATLVKGSLGTDEKVLLGPGADKASCEGDGGVWVAVEAAAPAPAGSSPAPAAAAQPPRAASAVLLVNGKDSGVAWKEAEGKVRCEAIPLEGFERQNTLALAVKDSAGREFDVPLGTLEVVPVPLKFEVVWSKAPPQEIGRGEFARIQGAVYVRGGLRAQREDARASLEKDASLLSATPASALRDFEIVPAAAAGDEAADAFGARVTFAASLRADSGNAELKDGFLIDVRSRDGKPIESRKVNIGPSALSLVVGRADGKSGVVPAGGLPLLARERLRAKVEGQTAPRTCRIQVFAAEAAPGDAAQPLVTAEGLELDWTPKAGGSYSIRAEADSGPGMGWHAEEKLVVEAALKIEWAADLAGIVKLDAGQKLPLSVKIAGPATLDRESFDRWFELKPEVVAEGGQTLVAEFEPWTTAKGGAAGSLVLGTVSTKPLSTSAAKARVNLLDRRQAEAAGGLDVLELTLVRGGGSLVTVENFEKGPQNYAVRDVGPGFSLTRGSRVRLGYRLGGSLDAGESLKLGVAASVLGPDGTEKVLDVETATRELVVFSPYETSSYGKHTLHLEIRGKTPLQRDFELEVVKGKTEWALTGALASAGLLALVGLCFLWWKGAAYSRDKRSILERVEARKQKTVAELEAEPRKSLAGLVRLTVANRSLGPIDLGGNPTPKEVDAWVDQHFSMDTGIFSDVRKNDVRLPVIQACLDEARTELCAITESRLPVLAADICLREVKDGGAAPRLEAEILHDGAAARPVEGRKTLLSLRIVEGGKLRVSTTSGRGVTMNLGEDFSYNGWIGKSGSQVRASVKVPGVADYSTLIIDLK